jgi:oligopeptide/dipeptide ABC transporter ATP-binding protein
MQIVKLREMLARDFDVAVLFVTHDFGVVAQICDRVSVIYAGQTVEIGTAAQIFDAPLRVYFEMLMRCHPEKSSGIFGIPGQVSSPLEPPSGCAFKVRCPMTEAACAEDLPKLTPSGRPGHLVACPPSLHLIGGYNG